MQTETREALDADLGERYLGITEYRTKENRHEVDCSWCGKVYYTDNITYENILRAMEFGPDSSFVCDECGQETDAQAYGAH